FRIKLCNSGNKKPRSVAGLSVSPHYIRLFFFALKLRIVAGVVSKPSRGAAAKHDLTAPLAIVTGLPVGRGPAMRVFFPTGLAFFVFFVCKRRPMKPGYQGD